MRFYKRLPSVRRPFIEAAGRAPSSRPGATRLLQADRLSTCSTPSQRARRRRSVRLPGRQTCRPRRVTAVLSPSASPAVWTRRSGQQVNRCCALLPDAEVKRTENLGTGIPASAPAAQNAPAKLVHHLGALSIRSRLASSRLAGAVKTFSKHCEIDSSGCALRYSSALTISAS
jgi:hypothetical protein